MKKQEISGDGGEGDWGCARPTIAQAFAWAQKKTNKTKCQRNECAHEIN